MLRAEAPDVVHNLSPTFFWFGALAWRLPESVAITTLHDVTNHPGDFRSAQVPVPLVRWSLLRSQALIVHGLALAKQAELRFPSHRDRIHALPLLSFKRYWELAAARGLTPKRDGVLRVLCFGRMLPYKGISELIASAGWITRERANVRFVIAGDGPSLAEARAEAPPDADIEWIDRFVTDGEVAQLFLDADIVALPYIEASQSGVLSLAATFGKPVVTTRVGSLHEVVEPSRMGLLVHPGAPRDFARALLELADDPVKRAEMGKNAHQVAETTLSHTAVAEHALRIYRSTREPLP
jgi:glycosyltransferase involved in cell wall biosynthesis